MRWGQFVRGLVARSVDDFTFIPLHCRQRRKLRCAQVYVYLLHFKKIKKLPQFSLVETKRTKKFQKIEGLPKHDSPHSTSTWQCRQQLYSKDEQQQQKKDKGQSFANSIFV